MCQGRSARKPASPPPSTQCARADSARGSRARTPVPRVLCALATFLEGWSAALRTRGLGRQRQCARTTTPRAPRVHAAAETKMAGSKCWRRWRAGMLLGTRRSAGARARRSPSRGGGVRARGGCRGHERAPPGRGWRERGRGHRGHPLQG